MENINQFTRVGTFCEKCRNVICACKIGEDSSIIHPLENGLGEPNKHLKNVPKAIDGNYKWIVLDGLVYRVRKDHYCELNSSVAAACGMCNDDTLMDIKKACDIIKSQYKPYTKPHQNFSTPDLEIKDDTDELKF